MTLPQTKIEEKLSETYVRAVVFRAGFNLSYFEEDLGLDGTIVSPKPGMNRIDYQLKATASTSRYSIRGDSVFYRLDSDAYNLLTDGEGTPRVLILFIMPDDREQWLSQTHDELRLRKCAYWASLMGMQRTSNPSTLTVEVQMENIFSPDGLPDMIAHLCA